MNISYRFATKEDAPRLAELSFAFEPSRLVGDLSNGYIPNPTSKEAFGRLASEGNVVVGDVDGEPVAYYALNHYQYSPSQDYFQYLKSQMDAALVQIGRADAKCACGAQCVVDLPYQGKGVRTQMLKLLESSLREKYEFFFSKITKDNPKALSGHGKDGWKAISEDEINTFVLYKL